MKDESVKIALDSRKRNEITVKRKAQMPNMEELMRPSRRNLDLQIQFRLRLRSAHTLKISQKLVHNRRNRRKLHQLLPFPERVLRVSGYTDDLSRKDRPDTGKQKPSMVRRYYRGNERIQRRAHVRINRRPNKARKRWIQTERNKIRIFQNRN